jgi:hypothetical protein
MAKKAVMEVDDFNLLVGFITKQSVPFHNAAIAVEVNAALNRATLMDIEIKQPEEPLTVVK